MPNAFLDAILMEDYGITQPPGSAQEYILMPERGVAEVGTGLPMELLTSWQSARSTRSAMSIETPLAPHLRGRVIDSIHENGPKLVEMTAEEVRELRRHPIGLRLEPIRYYWPALSHTEVRMPAPMAGGRPLPVQIVSATTGAALGGARVKAFTDFPGRAGATGTSDAAGMVLLDLGSGPVLLERLYIQAPEPGYWGAYFSPITIVPSQVFQLRPLSFPFVDSMRHFFPTVDILGGAGVKVGVIDTGIGPHPDLSVTGGRNTVRGEPEGDWHDNGSGHGTHVAGIIASKGSPAGVAGLAPAVELRSYRVYGVQGGPTTNYSIIKAIINALDDGCDVINFSLTGDPANDEPLRSAMEDARDRGVLIVAAAGNQYRTAVVNPTRYAYREGLVVSALGRTGTFPPGSYEESHVNSSPGGNDSNDFIADFTNIGDVSFVAPGVGVISSVPGGYAPRSGTSMACPVVSALAARVLSTSPNLQVMPRDRSRVTSWITELSSRANSLGFPYACEGVGMPT